MSDSESSVPQDDSDEDIYKDIPDFNFEDEWAELENKKETYKQEANDLSEKVQTLREENEELKKSNEVLKKNLSILLKTAQAEVQRKDSMIEELRSQVDSFTFRRNKTVTKDKYTNTDDLTAVPIIPNVVHKYEKNIDSKRSKSCENQINCDNVKMERKRGKETKKENSNCDNERKSDHYRENSRSKYKSFENSRDKDKYKDKKSRRFKSGSSYRCSYRENHRDHLKYDSYDKKRHSRSSDLRHKNSNERRDDHKRDKSSHRRRRSEDGSERSRRRNSQKGRSRSREFSREITESSFEESKSRSSLDTDFVTNKNTVNGEVLSKSRNGASGVENKKQVENSGKRESQAEDPKLKSKQKENRVGKQEKKTSSDMFSTKSPLDALYNDMVTSRNSNRFSNAKAATPESTVVEDEIFNHETNLENQTEDWTLSFKNERSNNAKFMTLYSRRMMRKFSSEAKATEKVDCKLENNPKDNNKKQEQDKAPIVDDVKEPGELTDDENIIESSKEFQELAKVASIESEVIEEPKSEKGLIKQNRKDFSATENPVELSEEKETCKEEPVTKNESEAAIETRDVIEFSPFKNNYKLIRISPTKPSNTEHVLNYYTKKSTHSQNSTGEKVESEKNANELSDTSGEKDSWKNVSSEKDSETELKISISSPPTESPEEKKPEDIKEKNPKKKENKKEDADSVRGKRNKKETETPDKIQTRKRKPSENEAVNCKKRKVETCRKNTRNKRNSKSETETEKEIKTKEDISCFEFFKPVTNIPKTPACATTDYKMTTTMNVTKVVRLETPHKCVEKSKNVTINEQMILNVSDSKNDTQLSPFMGSKCIEMTPRRILKNDLMLTDSEDDSAVKSNAEKEVEEKKEQEEEVEEEGSENSGCESDSGASDFVDLL